MTSPLEDIFLMVAVKFSLSLNLGAGFIMAAGTDGGVRGGRGAGSARIIILKLLVEVFGDGLSSVSTIVTLYEPG